MSTRSSVPPSLDDLRRHLYTSEASAQDVARYEALRGRPDEPPEVADPRHRPRRHRRVAIAGATLAVAIAVTAGVLVGRPIAAPGSVASPAPAATIVQEEVPTAASARATFVARLESGSESGLLRYLYRHPELLPPELRTVGRADSTEYSGVGPSVLSLSPSALADHGGRATVIVVIATAGRYEWLADRDAADGDRAGSEPAVATKAGETQAGAPVSSTFGYEHVAPSRLSMLVAEGTRWGAVVVFTD